MSPNDRLDELSRDLLSTPYDELKATQKSVIDLIAAEAPTGLNTALLADDRTYWDRLADKVAAVGGSWAFIGGFCACLALWIVLNVGLRPFHLSFDPYPFIFLNLILSTVAAIQAPVIMMSQNRQALKDRLNAEHDYVVNLRAELEIMRLHAKLDALREQEMVEILRGNTETLELLKARVETLSRGESGPVA
uniref:Cyclic nucleotide-binding protein n=1 Tax=Caulobacter sp. (strain K31) TaxID=366602 RepID=B0SZB1_CAUSK